MEKYVIIFHKYFVESLLKHVTWNSKRNNKLVHFYVFVRLI